MIKSLTPPKHELVRFVLISRGSTVHAVGKLEAAGRGAEWEEIASGAYICTFSFRKLNDCSIWTARYMPEDTNKL
jgi:hypothetical protein